MAISEPSESWEALLVGRLVVGLCAGLNTVIVPTYVSEVAPVSIRGGIGILNQLGNAMLTRQDQDIKFKVSQS